MSEKDSQGQGYEAPSVEQVDTADHPSVTAAGPISDANPG
jgi:hypothetical protein